MSSFKVEVVQIQKIGKHPNADRLFITSIYKYPVIFNADAGHKAGDLVAYVPVDAVVPMTPEWAWLGDKPKHHRIKAKKIRGIFSMGLLVPAPEGSKAGEDVAKKLGIIKYLPPEPIQANSEDEKDPGFIPCYTDIENFRRYGHLINDGEEVIIVEKIHGCNGRAVYHSETDRLWLGSRTRIKKEDPKNLWWKAAFKHGLPEKLKKFPDLVFYFEVYGQVQDLKYGAEKNDLFIRCFDVFDLNRGIFLQFDEAQEFIKSAGLDAAPTLYRGPWKQELIELADGQSMLADNIREGFVVRPEEERWSEETGRVILKVIGQAYLLRKKGTEYR